MAWDDTDIVAYDVAHPWEQRNVALLMSFSVYGDVGWSGVCHALYGVAFEVERLTDTQAAAVEEGEERAIASLYP